MTEQRAWHKYYDDRMKAYDSGKTRYNLLGDVVDVAAGRYGDNKAFATVLPNGAAGELTFNELKESSDAFAAYLREVLGLKQGDTVAVQSPNCVGYPIAIFGAMKAGCRATNVNPLYTEPEMEHQFNDSKAKVLVIIDMFGDKVDKVVPKTGVKHVVTLSVVDFFPTLKRLLIGTVLKHVKKQIPAMNTPATPFMDALKQGRAAIKRGADISSYCQGIDQNDTAVFQYTGGTTGRSKGAELTHKNILSNLDQNDLFMGGLIETGKDAIMTPLPLYHIFAFTVSMCLFIDKGCLNVLVPSPRPVANVKPAFDNYPITWMPGVNTLYAGLLQEEWFRSNPPKMKIAVSGGTSLHEAVANEWEKVVGIKIYEGYGLTESSPVLTFNPVSSGESKLNSIGVPVPGVDIRIVDDEGNEVAQGERGELIAHGPNIMKGYLDRPDATAETIKDGWLYTGDVAIMDDDGFFKIVDRKKDMILVSGFNVYPNELEDVLSKMDGIIEAAVIGVPDDKSGEAPKAFVVKSDASLTESDVRNFCKENMTGYKVPKHVEFRDELPKTPVGKILRKDLKAEEAAKR